MAYRISKRQPPSREESGKAVHVARITAMAEQVFGESVADSTNQKWLGWPAVLHPLALRPANPSSLRAPAIAVR